MIKVVTYSIFVEWGPQVFGSCVTVDSLASNCGEESCIEILSLFDFQKLPKICFIKLPGFYVYCYFKVSVTEVSVWWKAYQCNLREEYR